MSLLIRNTVRQRILRSFPNENLNNLLDGTVIVLTPQIIKTDDLNNLTEGDILFLLSSELLNSDDLNNLADALTAPALAIHLTQSPASDLANLADAQLYQFNLLTEFSDNANNLFDDIAGQLGFD